ncbi:hypothetical protein, partial [Aeromonas caviae]|uniref:hypothetical protein n=1 Tax=Aeromonas caviae TaxID=648 RepID=UPI001CC6476E
PQSSASARRIPVRILSGNGVHRFRNHCSTSPEYAIKVVDVKQDDLPDPFLDDCGVSHDSAFEEYTKPKPIKSVAPTKPKATTYDNGYGRKCSQCYQQPNGDWDCRDSYCNNYLPF